MKPKLAKYLQITEKNKKTSDLEILIVSVGIAGLADRKDSGN